MDAKFCSECGTRLHDEAEYCPVCGTRYHEPLPPKKEEPDLHLYQNVEEEFQPEPEEEFQPELDEEFENYSVDDSSGQDEAEKYLPEVVYFPKRPFKEEKDIDPEPYAKPPKKEGPDSRLVLLLVMCGVVAVLLTLFIWFFFLKESGSDISWEPDPKEEIDEESYNNARLDPVVRIEEPVQEETAPEDELTDQEQGAEEDGTNEEERAPEPIDRGEKRFSGTVNGSPVSLTLNASTGNGYYTIVKDGVSQRMNLSCNVSPDGYITVYEYTPEGEYAGEWEGVYRDGVFSGQGSFQGSSSSFSFSETY